MLAAVFALKSRCIEIIQNHPVFMACLVPHGVLSFFCVVFFPPSLLDFLPVCFGNLPISFFLFLLWEHILCIPLEASYFIFSVFDDFSLFPVKTSRGLAHKTGSLFFGNLSRWQFHDSALCLIWDECDSALSPVGRLHNYLDYSLMLPFLCTGMNCAWTQIHIWS